jgi:hypothetical protein
MLTCDNITHHFKSILPTRCYFKIHRDLRYPSSYQLAVLKPYTPDFAFTNASILNNLIHATMPMLTATRLHRLHYTKIDLTFPKAHLLTCMSSCTTACNFKFLIHMSSFLSHMTSIWYKTQCTAT